MQIQKAIVTNVNFGYIPLLENMRYFLEKAGLLQFLHVYAIGKKCKRALDRMGIDSVLIEDDLAGDKAVRYATGNWKMVSYQKIRTIRLALGRLGSFLYADPDIIFQKDVFSFLETLPDSFDIYGQNDYPNHLICTGFIYIQDNAATRQVFSVPWEEYHRRTKKGDQVYIDGCSDQLSLYALPRELFLNGAWFVPSMDRFVASREMVRDAYIVHYNYAKGLPIKYARMQKNGHLYPKLARPRFLHFLSKCFHELAAEMNAALRSMKK